MDLPSAGRRGKSSRSLTRTHMSEEALIVLSTFPDAETARSIGRTLVEERLAACVNLIPQIESIYRWKGAIETSSETVALIKTSKGKYQMLEERIRALHPYEVPEIVSVQILDGFFEYLNWINDSVR
jgi:periplasmic divalent cation tolerance protein